MTDRSLSQSDTARTLYIELLKNCLTYWIWINEEDKIWRMTGEDWPEKGDTMIGIKRMNNLRMCVEDVISNNIEGDLIETGVWRGGATIFMRGILKAYDIIDRNVWVADSFEGLPKPNVDDYPFDKNVDLHLCKELQISMEAVKTNFSRYGLLDDQVKFVKGWFKDTLPHVNIHKLAVLRLDGDLFESTMDALVSLYPKVSEGGYIIVDDYGVLDCCRYAVEAYRREHGISDKIIRIDGSGVYWKKGSTTTV